MRIMTFSDFRAHSEPLFKKSCILKLDDNIKLNNCLFVYDFLKGKLPNSYNDTFLRLKDITTNCSTRRACTGMLYIPRYKTTNFGLKCIYKRCINSWNQFTSEFNQIEKQKHVNKFKCPDIDLVKFSRDSLKKKLTSHILSKYDD